MNALRCALGNHWIAADEPYYVRVRGWEKPGRGAFGRSGSSLILRERLPEAACGVCIARVVAGVSPQQGTLL